MSSIPSRLANRCRARYQQRCDENRFGTNCGCGSARSRQVSRREALVLAPLLILALLRGFCGTLAGRQCYERYDVIHGRTVIRSNTVSARPRRGIPSGTGRIRKGDGCEFRICSCADRSWSAVHSTNACSRPKPISLRVCRRPLEKVGWNSCCRLDGKRANRPCRPVAGRRDAVLANPPTHKLPVQLD